mmetsp:Transcript_13523/g.19107  ORF Transcript_13523/g.19107 Transcript_13523/m.19107 type:complete len:426 (-) Transcript_13523:277-1554(-)
MSDDRRRSRSRSRERNEGPPYGGGVAVGGAAPPSMVYNAPPAGALPGLQPQIPGVPNVLLNAQQAAQEKINRELFVGNTPPGTTEMLLMQFLNGAMRRVGLCDPNATPILNCRVNQKFAFVECTSAEVANKTLNLNGIPFLGALLKVSRPSKYTGPPVVASTWQQLTGQAVPTDAMIDSNAEDKVMRELFVGNTTPEMTEQMLKDFLGNAMVQVGLNQTPGNPILTCRVSGKFAFIELRTREEAANALNLNNIPYLGAQLRVGRPSKYTGPITQHGNWEDILAKYMSGELQLPSQGGTGAAATVPAPATAPAPGAGIPAAAAAPSAPASRVVELKNMLSEADLENPDEYEEIMEDTKGECSQFGALKNVIIPRKGEVGMTKIFLEYMTTEDAAKAIQGLAGRTFDGRKVAAAYFDETKFANKDYS